MNLHHWHKLSNCSPTRTSVLSNLQPSAWINLGCLSAVCILRPWLALNWFFRKWRQNCCETYPLAPPASLTDGFRDLQMSCISDLCLMLVIIPYLRCITKNTAPTSVIPPATDFSTPLPDFGASFPVLRALLLFSVVSCGFTCSSDLPASCISRRQDNVRCGIPDKKK